MSIEYEVFKDNSCGGTSLADILKLDGLKNSIAQCLRECSMHAKCGAFDHNKNGKVDSCRFWLSGSKESFESITSEGINWAVKMGPQSEISEKHPKWIQLHCRNC